MADGSEVDEVRYVDWVEYPHARVRVEIDTNRGIPTRFVVQLERRVNTGWQQVVRFDHDSAAPDGHDITKEGLHMDVYRDGRKVRVKRDFPPVHLTDAPRYCITYIREYADRLLGRFDKWHDLNDPTKD